MFCYQCEQRAGGGCSKVGVCGKTASTAELQDLIIHGVKGLSRWAHRARKLGAVDGEIDRFTMDALFTTVTNVSFDDARLTETLVDLGRLVEKAETMYRAACRTGGTAPEELGGEATWRPVGDTEALVEEGRHHGIEARKNALGDDVCGLQELLVYGLKGTAAYAHHAAHLGQEDAGVYAFFHEALDFLCTDEAKQVDPLVAMNLRCGEVNLEVMELLDRANTGRFGTPEPTAVRIHPKKGKAILVSGHDLGHLKALLEQTEGKGVNVYTHGEMLPCLAYPELKKHAHLAGNYGGAWQDQRKEFDAFPGAILMTTNCIQKPAPTYQERIFTSGLVSWPGVTHVDPEDFGPVIEAALAAPGFAEDGPDDTITIGFGHGAVLGVADQVIDAVKRGAIRHFFLVGGCDGAKPGRNYYTELAEKIPDDCVILTLACGKFRFNKLAFGDIGGIPRLLDMGQCNDAYSAIKVAGALAEAFGTDVNGLPLSLVLSWYEQKAVCILLSLLHLGIKGIRLGPSLPAFIGPNVLKVLVENFEIAPTTTVDEDLKTLLG